MMNILSDFVSKKEARSYKEKDEIFKPLVAATIVARAISFICQSCGQSSMSSDYSGCRVACQI